MAGTEVLSRIKFLEEENRRLASDRDQLKSERRQNEEDRWEELRQDVSKVHSSVQQLSYEVRESNASTGALRAVVMEMKDDQKKSTKLLTGGDEPETGILFRTKKVEDKQDEHETRHKESHKWWVGLGTVVLVTAFKTAWDTLFKKP